MSTGSLVDALLARVLLDDATTPLPLFWLGAHEPWWAWDGSTDRRLLVTATRLRDRLASGGRKRGGELAKGVMQPATCQVFLDSGAFTQLSREHTWATWPIHDFAEFVDAAYQVLGRHRV